ncbi:MAG: DinB family protein [Chloroflexi bacterium]|nr:DinB family protein [Chloroflexota bacterium]
MDFERCVEQMEHNAQTIRSLTMSVSAAQARWHPAPDAWSMLEVINHLYDEEREDFRHRLQWIWQHPAEPWAHNDPPGWVTARRYNERNFEESVNNFLFERERSVVWLRELASPDWSVNYHTGFRDMTAGDMFASWVAHDLLHIRQLVELHWAWTVDALKPHQVEYAGDW